MCIYARSWSCRKFSVELAACTILIIMLQQKYDCYCFLFFVRALFGLIETDTAGVSCELKFRVVYVSYCCCLCFPRYLLSKFLQIHMPHTSVACRRTCVTCTCCKQMCITDLTKHTHTPSHTYICASGLHIHIWVGVRH